MVKNSDPSFALRGNAVEVEKKPDGTTVVHNLKLVSFDIVNSNGNRYPENVKK